DENVQLAFLYDTYGELLSRHQRQIFEAVRFDDLSLAEIAEEYDISRQAAHDVYRRTVQKLEHYESVLHLVERDRRVKGKVEAIARIAGYGRDPEGSAPQEDLSFDTDGMTAKGDGHTGADERFERIAALAAEVLEEL
ncbi:MAG: hypothetical protein IJT32_06050, partial [Lachnospiraceae bacterium]|nr:hypothetical protein [Lachnospiraceae bacterium]